MVLAPWVDLIQKGWPAALILNEYVVDRCSTKARLSVPLMTYASEPELDTVKLAVGAGKAKKKWKNQYDFQNTSIYVGIQHMTLNELK